MCGHCLREELEILFLRIADTIQTGHRSTMTGERCCAHPSTFNSPPHEQLITGLDRNPFHMLNTRRNAFAHQDVHQSIRWEPPEDGSSRGLKFVVESMKGDGEFEVLTREEAYAQFMDAFAKVHKCLHAMQGQLVGRKYAPQILGEEPGDS